MDSSESSTNPTPIPESQQPLLPNQQQQEVAAAVGTTSTVIGINKINPLDNLSQLELRKKLDSSRNELRKALDRKKRIDKDLVSSLSFFLSHFKDKTKCFLLFVVVFVMVRVNRQH